MSAEICGVPFPFGARIASDELDERLKAVDESIAWLKDQKKFDIDDGQKLWYVYLNGLWKTDLWQNQHALARKLSNILLEIPDFQCEIYISSFFTGVGKEWSHLDKWRIEKFLVLVRAFVETIFEWAKKNNKIETYIPQLCTDVLSLQNCIGLQLQFIDVIADPLSALMKKDTKIGGEYLKPFSSIFAKSHSQAALVIRINDKLIEPLMKSDGESLFGNDIDAILKFMRGFISLLNSSLKQQESSPRVAQIRYDTAAQVRQLIADILTAKEQAGAPPEKTTD
ncbi:Nucleolar protein,Nop52 containing protein [Tritrichomonas foetus]|uniref:Nucleolar protein,Nop52 containing protein n=1 Tax=Tritrichomonas foetus TaxID=1144522 RepID=A0A1J4JEE3_9EUKA|nr:Nucleolar protein,Nop52 containing protein [Tritrichomonas foetus]|eukprot:OHS97530.1 Nucleolar protein,Nop52 containing protein [Tritrichomonas foetus]